MWKKSRPSKPDRQSQTEAKGKTVKADAAGNSVKKGGEPSNQQDRIIELLERITYQISGSSMEFTDYLKSIKNKNE